MIIFVVCFIVSLSNVTRSSGRPVEENTTESFVGVLWNKLQTEVRFYLSLCAIFGLFIISSRDAC